MNKNRKGQSAPAIIGGIAVVAFAVFIVLMLGVDVVDANYRGVKVKFGKILGPMEPGIEWTGLFTHVYQYDLKIRKATIDMEGSFNAPDKTGQAVFAQINVNYRIRPDSVEQLYRNVGKDKEIADRLNIHPIIAEGFKQATVKYEALEILGKRQEVKELAKENIRNNFPHEYFEIVDIVISNIHFSNQFEEALDAKKIAIQRAAEAKENLEKVKFEQQQEIEKYKAEAEKLRLQKAEITELLVHQKWIEKWNGQLPLYMITSEDNTNMMLMLPEGE